MSQNGGSQEIERFWSVEAGELLRRLRSSPEGLSTGEAEERLRRYGPNRLGRETRGGDLALLLGQFKSPIVLLLLLAALLSGFLADRVDAAIIMVIVLASGLLGFFQERGAQGAVARLLERVAIKAAVLRDRKETLIRAELLVPGDVVVLQAGDAVPADCSVLQSRELFADESVLTGESFPVEKEARTSPAEAPMAKRANMLYMGSHIVSGSAKALVVLTGRSSVFGELSERLKLRPEENAFERGVRHFGYLLMEVTLVLVLAIFAVNVYLAKPVLDSFLFALALAVGLTPQLLPAIVSINLSRGASKMAEHDVIVKRLESIENLGAMSVLCADKTGTLTVGKVTLKQVLGCDGRPSDFAKKLAYLNSGFETGFKNPIDEAIRASEGFDVSGYRKLDEEPYDFFRKRLSVLAEGPEGRVMATKGAVDEVLSVCDRCRNSDGSVTPLAQGGDLPGQAKRVAGTGDRVLGIAYRDDVKADRIGKDDERGMVFAGFLDLYDPPKPEAAKTIQELASLGVELKIITGDAEPVARELGKQMGLGGRIITGPGLDRMSELALSSAVADTGMFAEIEPNQKERIIAALMKSGKVTGFLGDGINDSAALHAADVGVSVDTAADVAKQAADIVLMRPGLDVLAEGIRLGRVTFANTLKYVFMATSANFGNMFSMAGASLFLPFLPLLPTQILLTNLLTDVPETTIAGDSVDPELVQQPRVWDIGFIARFMSVFGLLSSVYDYMTFGTLLLLLHASPMEFRTGWFVESVISASMIVLVIRTRRPFWKSRPSRNLALATLAIAAVTLSLPYTPLGPLFRFTALDVRFYPALAAILVLYVGTAELTKAVFYRRHGERELAPRKREPARRGVVSARLGWK